MAAVTGRILYSQIFVSIPEPNFDLTGQTVIVTGSNTGLGLEAARHVARLNAKKVIIAVRTVSKGTAALKNIALTCKTPGQKLEVWELDMGDVNSIKRFAQRAKEAGRIDAAILNAGVMSEKWNESNGIESTLAVNVIGTALLSYLLYPTLAATAKKTGQRARLAIVGSEMMYMANRKPLEVTGSIIERLNDKAYATEAGDRYPQSKQLIFYALHKLAMDHPLALSNVLVDVLTPGACQSDLFRDGKGFIMNLAWNSLARSTEVGARTLAHGIDTALPDEAHGGFLFNCGVDVHAKPLLEGAANERLYKKWNLELAGHLERIAPGSTRI